MMTACPPDWQQVKLGELGEVNRGRSRHRPRDALHLYGGVYPFIQTGDIKASRGKITTHTQTYSEAGLTQSRLWPKDAMVITIAANIAETAILGYPACFPDSVVGFIANPEKADVRFIEYLFRSLRKRIQHENVGTGSVQDNINMQTLQRLNLTVPNLAGQKAIAAILGALDDKIELNRRTNATLEAMARALFKSWFVDFDPVRAKMEGKTPFGMDSTTASLFPSRLIPSELGDIPEGWDMPKFSALFDIIGGGTPKTSVEEYWSGDISWFSVVDAPSDTDVFVMQTDKTITQKGVDESSTRILPSGTTIISARGTVGRLALVGQPMAMNQSCYGLSPANGIGAAFLYFSTRKAVAELQSHAHGSVFDTITRDTFDGLTAIKPPATITEAFENLAWPLLEKIRGNLVENIKLEKTRDYLLPKLISGDIRIRDVEKFIGATQ